MQSLLDTNVLIALLWPEHPFHSTAQNWFQKNSRSGWATCPITQGGFVRVVSNTAFSSHALSVPDAITALEKNLRHPAHAFWPDELTVAQSAALLQKPLHSYRQLTDAYLLSLAIYKRARFITFDKRIASLLAEEKRKSGFIVDLTVHLN